MCVIIRPAFHPTMERLALPEYTIPLDLEKVLSNDLKPHNGMSPESLSYLKILQALQNAKSINITETHYLPLLKLALYLEDYQCNLDMKKYELTNVKIARQNANSSTFQITVEEVDEERPWIRVNDIVDVVDVKSNVVYSLKVTNVQQNVVVATSEEKSNLGKTYSTEKLYNVKFRFQNYPIRCSHFALSRIRQQGVTTYLFPHTHKSYIPRDLSMYNDIKVFNQTIAKNPEQKQAVIHIVNKSSFPAPYILYGPPGTGKTATLVEAMCQIHNDSKQRILVCTPSNTAADEVTRRLLVFIPPQFIYRIYSQSKDVSTIEGDLRLCSNYEGDKITHVKQEGIENKRIIITTLCYCMRLIQMRLAPGYFSHIIIDEAGQSTEPDILIPISLASHNTKLCSQIVVAGDPQQLGPTVISKLAEVVLGRSILERLMSYDIYQKGKNNEYNPKFITKLLINYRSHPRIVHISNELFYDNELYSQFRNKCEKNIFPIIFHGVRGKEDKYSHSPSSCNHKEVQMVMDYVDALLENSANVELGSISQEDIGIVTPFVLQSKMIKKKLKMRNLKDINVGTVELFQGQERKVMIMTTVRSKAYFHEGRRHIGFLSHPKRFNVGITRAKNLLIVIGNPAILQIDYKWHYLLQYCIDNDSYRGVKFFLDPLADKQGIELERLAVVDSPALLKSDQGNDLLKPLDAILFPEVPAAQKTEGKLDFWIRKLENEEKVKVRKPNNFVRGNRPNYYNNNHLSASPTKEKSSRRCNIL